MPDRGSIESTVLAGVRSRSAKADAVTLASPLFDGGADLDSIQFLELVLDIESRLGVRLRDQEMTQESLATVGALVRHVERIGRERG